MSAPSVTPELQVLLRRVKLGPTPRYGPPNASRSPTPAAWATPRSLELVLADEVSPREATSADRRARAAGRDPKRPQPRAT